MLEPTEPNTMNNDGAAPDAPPAPAPRKRAPRKSVRKAAAPEPVAEAGPAGSPAPPTDSPAPPTDSPASPAQAAGAASGPAPRKRAPRKAAARPAPADTPAEAVGVADMTADAGPAGSGADGVETARPAKRAPRRSVKKAAAAVEPAPDAAPEPPAAQPAPDIAAETSAAAPPRTSRKRTARKAVADDAGAGPDAGAASEPAAAEPLGEVAAPTLAAAGVLFQAPAADPPATPSRRHSRRSAAPAGAGETDGSGAPSALVTGSTDEAADAQQRIVSDDVSDDDTDDGTDDETDVVTADAEDVKEAAIEQASGARRRRRRGRRGRGGRQGEGDDEAGVTDADDESDADDEAGPSEVAEAADTDETADDAAGTPTARRRRRRRSGSGGGGGDSDAGASVDDPPNTITHVRESRRNSNSNSINSDDDGVRGVRGSTRLEAKRQRRRDGRETTRRRTPILSEAEFLARRESVDRVMAVRQTGERTQIAVLEDGILVEHYVTRASATSYVGNVYLGRVQNVLPSMEAAFIDIGKGRNGVLYAGEVNWDAAGLEGKSRAIEQAMKSGDTVLVQVTKDPIGHKGARLTSQVSLPGRFVVLVPGGGMTGISRRLPDTERHRLKAILKKVVPEEAGVIVRTAAEGASEEDLTRDVERLTAQWAEIEHAASTSTKSAPTLVHGEPDLAIRVVRDVFNEDFASMLVEGDEAWPTISQYVEGVAADLAGRVHRHTGDSDLFADLRVDEQLAKALDRKVFLPSGGSLVIDRTEAMTVVDVNTGKFVGSGGNLEQTVTRNNLEAAEEIVRQLRLRDVGGIVVIDFIDMVLESNRDLVLRRLTECLGRDRTKHQVAEVTSLGLVQMTRKRVGEGLLEAFSDTCEVCHGRGVIVHAEPVDRNDAAAGDDDEPGKQGRRRRGGRGNGAAEPAEPTPAASHEQRRAATAAIAAIHRAANGEELDMPAELPAEVGADAPFAAQQVLDEAIRSVAVVELGTAPAPATNGSGPTAPVETAPVETAPVETAPVETAPVETAPVETAPVETAPVRRRRRVASRPAGPPTGA